MKFVDDFLAGRKFVHESLGQMKAHAAMLAGEILEKYGAPDQIIYIERGGMVIGRLLSDALLVKNVSGIKASYYLGINKRAGKVTIGTVPQLNSKANYILLVDDVADTGKTLTGVAEAIKRKHNVKVVTCTVFYKPRSVIKPDFYASEITDDKWIIFEYEENEFKEKRRS